MEDIRYPSRWREVRTNLDDLAEVNVIYYADYLNKMLLTFNNSQVSDEGIYIGAQPALNIGGLYYFKNVFPYRLPSDWNNRIILCRLYRVYPSDLSNEDEGIWLSLTGGEVTQFTALYWCYIEGVFDYESEVLNYSKLSKFKNVVDDNKYFDKIPLINEITHWDNGIVSHVTYRVDAATSGEPDEWDSITIQWYRDVSKDTQILKMLKENHERPDR